MKALVFALWLFVTVGPILILVWATRRENKAKQDADKAAKLKAREKRAETSHWLNQALRKRP